MRSDGLHCGVRWDARGCTALQLTAKRYRLRTTRRSGAHQDCSLAQPGFLELLAALRLPEIGSEASGAHDDRAVLLVGHARLLVLAANDGLSVGQEVEHLHGTGIHQTMKC